MRRFEGTYVWDDRGTVLGNEGGDGCIGECPATKDMPDSARDLDAFQVERLEGEPARIRVGAPSEGTWRRIPHAPLPSWSQEPFESAPRALSVEQAMALPEGTIVSVKGDAVLASASPPRVCVHLNSGSCCAEGSPRLYDVDGIPLRPHVGPEVSTHFVPLLRRYRDGFVQYDVGAKLGAPYGGSVLEIPPPPDVANWDPAQPPRAPLCP
ncbi:hypothetical protein [Corallococcus sp. EGB]|uniref:hypothetical protein n=1 Tax=Corallococcus sp. EGB TaxID=1521117 RepID=UPI001CBBE0DC|nr:hypothetical protein [Corallococcus sp. EGB]